MSITMHTHRYDTRSCYASHQIALSLEYNTTTQMLIHKFTKHIHHSYHFSHQKECWQNVHTAWILTKFWSVQASITNVCSQKQKNPLLQEQANDPEEESAPRSQVKVTIKRKKKHNEDIHFHLFLYYSITFEIQLQWIQNWEKTVFPGLPALKDELCWCDWKIYRADHEAKGQRARPGKENIKGPKQMMKHNDLI